MAEYRSLDTTSFLARYWWLIIPSYLLVGVLFYRHVEGWAWVDSFYFCVVCLTTVGYGDFVPDRPAAKAFTAAFLLLGLSLVAASLSAGLSQLQSRLPRRKGGSKRSRASVHAQHFGLAVLGLFAMALAGGTVVHIMEGWNWWDSFYFALITCASVGFGDLQPAHWQTRLFLAFFLLAAVTTFGHALGQVASVIMEIEQERAVARFVARGVSAELIREIDIDGNGQVDKLEFLEHMLVSTGKVEHSEIGEILALFDRLDADGSGYIGPEDAMVSPGALEPLNARLAPHTLRAPLVAG